MTGLRCVSTFAGIGGFDVGFERAGMTVTTQVEIDKHARTVLHNHYPTVPLLGDISDVHGTDLGALDVLVGGFPCQDVSKGNTVRKGLDGARSGLFFQFARLVEEYARLVDETNPRWVVLENVPGLLSSGRKPRPGVVDPDVNDKSHWIPDGGADFQAVIGTLADLGYVGAWRVVNTRLVRGAGGTIGLPQERRRVIVVGHRGEHPGARAVLADFAAGTEDARLDHSGQGGNQGRSPAGPRTDGDRVGLIFRKSKRAQSTADYSTWVEDRYGNTLTGFDSGMARATTIVTDGDRARILTPVEWERMQGFPDNWTEGVPITARWHLLGNAISTNVSEWLGHRIASVPLLAAA